MLLIPGILASKFTPQGDFESIATVVVGSGGTSEINFTSIPGSFQHLQIRAIARANSGGGSGTGGLVTQFNADTGSNYTASHVLFGNGASAISGATGTSQTSGSITNFPQSSATASSFGVFVADILDYSSTNKNKTVRSLGGFDGNDTNGIIVLRSFAWMNSGTAITSIKFSNSGNGFAQHSHFALYGIKG